MASLHILQRRRKINWCCDVTAVSATKRVWQDEWMRAWRGIKRLLITAINIVNQQWMTICPTLLFSALRPPRPPPPPPHCGFQPGVLPAGLAALTLQTTSDCCEGVCSVWLLCVKAQLSVNVKLGHVWGLACMLMHGLYCELIWAGMPLTEADKRLKVSNIPSVKAFCSFDLPITCNTACIVHTHWRPRNWCPHEIQQQKSNSDGFKPECNSDGNETHEKYDHAETHLPCRVSGSYNRASIFLLWDQTYWKS